MTLFWAGAAALVVIALLFVVPPLLRRPVESAAAEGPDLAIYRDHLADLERDLQSGVLSPEQFESARRELERRLADELESSPAPVAAPPGGRAVTIVVIAGIPLLAIALYAGLGELRALDPVATTPRDAAHSVTAEQIEQMVAGLARRLQDEPDDPAGWSMLGRSYAAMGRFSEAADAYARAVKRVPDDAQLLADYADALGMAQGRTLKGEPRRIIARALVIDPDHVKALALAGTAAFQDGDYAGAVKHWERLIRRIPADSEFSQSMAGSLAEARALAANPPPKGKTAAAVPDTGAAAGEKAIRGKVRLDAKLAAKASPDDTVFVFARAINGPRAPLAVRRYRVAQLPADFTLDRSAAMSPELTIAQFKEVVVGARISKSGNPVPQSGDLEGLRQPVRVGASGIEVVIDTVLP